MFLRRIAAMVGLPLVAMLESCAWFMGLTLMGLVLTDDVGMDHEAASSASAWLSSLGIGTVLLGGLLAAGTGPLVTLVLGLALSALGLALLPFVSAELVMVPIAILALGQGLHRPSLWAAAAEPFGFPREHLRGASLLLTYAGFNLGALLASPLASALRDAAGLRAVILTAAAMMALTTLIAAGVGACWLLQREQVAQERAAPHPAQGQVLMGVGILALLAFLPVLCWNQSWHLQIDLLQQLEGGLSWDLFFAINPAVVIAAGLLLAAVLAGLHFARLRLPTMAIVGLGLTVIGLGMALLVVPGINHLLPVLVVAMVLLSIGEILAIPLLTSRLVGDVHWRIAPLLIAAWLALTSGGGKLIGWLGETLELPLLPTVTGWVGAGSGLLFGLALLVAAFFLQRRLFEPPR